MAYFGPDGKPARHKDGNAVWRAEYDARGNQVAVVYLDEAGKPVQTKDGYNRVAKRYDEQNRMVEETRTGFDPAKGGYASTIIRYDDQGHVIEMAYFGPDGKPTRHKDGNAVWRAEYDAQGNQVALIYLDESGKPVRIKDGYARVTKRYDEQGNLIEMVSLDEAGRPVRDNTGYIGVTKRYDEQNRMIEETRTGFDSTKEGYASAIIRYDTQGHVVDWACFDEAGKPMRNKNGYARVRQTYDEQGNEIDRVYFDSDDKPVKTQVVVIRVLPGSEAARLGIKAGDVIVQYNKREVNGTLKYINEIKSEKPADPPKPLVVSRDGKTIAMEKRPGLLGAELTDRAVPDSTRSK